MSIFFSNWNLLTVATKYVHVKSLKRKFVNICLNLFHIQYTWTTLEELLMEKIILINYNSTTTSRVPYVSLMLF